MQAPLGVRAGVSQVGETRQAGRLRHVETKGETHRETESDQGRSIQYFFVTPSLLTQVNRRQLGKEKWPQEADWTGCPSMGLPPTAAPPQGPRQRDGVSSLLLCPGAPVPELRAGTFSFPGAPPPVLSTSHLLCPYPPTPREGEALGGWGKGALLSIFREWEARGSLTWQKCCCSACKPRSQHLSCLGFPEKAPKHKSLYF